METTDDEKTIKSWIETNRGQFSYLDIDKSSVDVQIDQTIWNSADIPPNITHPSVNFLSNPALLLNYNYVDPVVDIESEIKNIPNEYLNFNSTPGQPIDINQAEEISTIDPPKIILPIKDFDPIIDSRTPSSLDMNPENVVQKPALTYYTFELEWMNAAFDLITPIILSLYVFDASSGRRVSEQWAMVPDQFAEKLKDEYEFKNFESPKKVSFALGRPQVYKNQDVYDKLFLVVILDRPFILKGGAAVDDYYSNQKDANKKKAIAATKEKCIGGWSNTFAYGALPVADVVNAVNSGTILFDHVVGTQQADEEFLKHKLNKVRKNPTNFAIQIKFKVSKEQPGDPSVVRMNELYYLKPFFSFKYQEKLLIKLKTVILNLKLGMKGKNIATLISCSDGAAPLDIINGRSTFRTRCQYHCTQPMFQEDIILNLPHPVTPAMTISFQFFHLPSKKKKGSITMCGEGKLSILDPETGLMRPDGEYKIPLRIDPKMQDVDKNSKSYAVVYLELHSYLNSSFPYMNEILSGNFSNIKAVQKYDDIIPLFPVVMDTIFNKIGSSDKNAFDALISILKLIPIDQYDSRFVTLNKDQNIIFTSDRYLSFYAKFCALRNLDNTAFFKTFVSQWLLLSKEPATPERQDLISIPFMLEVLLKSILLKKEFIFSKDLEDLLFNLHKAIFSFPPESHNLAIRMNHFLSLLYKDLMEFCDRGRIFYFINHYLNSFTSIRINKFQQDVFVDFLSTFFSVKSFLYTMIPMKDDARSSFFDRKIAILIEEGLASSEHTSSVFSILLNMILRLNHQTIKLISPSLVCLVTIFGRNTAILKQNTQTKAVLIPFLLILTLIGNIDLNHLDDDFDHSCSFLIKTANEHILSNEPESFYINYPIGNYGYKNIFSLVVSDPSAPSEEASKRECYQSIDIWKNFAFMIQLICINYATLSNSIHILNNMMIPFFDIQVSSSLFSFAKNVIINYFKTNSNLIFTSPESRVYKLIYNVMKNPTFHNVELIDELWDLEKALFNTNNRCRAFTMRAIYKFKLNETHIPIFEKSCIQPLLVEYVKLTKEYASFDINDPNNHEYVADVLLKIANFFRPSPDTRVDVLLEIGSYHKKYGYHSENAISQLVAASIVAEYMRILDKIPNVFKDNEHPANSFKYACPCANLEVCPEEIMNDLPRIPGFCTSKYFSQTGMIYLIQSPIEICKSARLVELATKIHSILRPITELNHLWNVLQQHYLNGAVLWTILEGKATKEETQFGNYYRVEFQDNDTYIYRENGFANLWQVSERLKEKAKLYAKDKPIVVLNDGEGLSTAKMDPDKYYVHVKAVEQYFTNEEKQERVTTFEQNHNVLKFYFDIPYSKNAQQSIEYLMLKRTIYTVTHPMPYIVSRVRVPPENIEKILFSPIEYSCESLQKQVDKINEAANNGEFLALQPLIQGSLLTQVNEGPKKMAEVFLTGATENEHTLMLRNIFRKFLKANENAVKLHGEWVNKSNHDFMILQEELELGLNRLSSTLQPFLK